jgi:16S rRNA C967 or C1407 C5-methylase (RsmB/RsmF family)/NOL1/NOP2/fmu family ribosome biogenesis protein
MILPDSFLQLSLPLPEREKVAFAKALDELPCVSIRLNPSKAEGLPLPAGSRVPWCAKGRYLGQRPAFTFDPLFHAGAFYVQEASSMFVEQAFKQHAKGNGLRILDLCAAPGGKSTHLASLMTEDSLLVANEVIRSRANILAENMTKWGCPNVVVTNSDPAEIGQLTGFFDVILMDAPCSGEGMFRKDAEAVGEWSPANVELCRERQRRIAADVWNSLKPNGILIYSTCTYNRYENEDNIAWICDNLGAEALPVETDKSWNISPAYDEGIHACHFFPHKLRGEGFFLAVLRKRGGEEAPSTVKRPKKKGKKPNAPVLSGEFRSYIRHYEDYEFFSKGDSLFAFPRALYGDFQDVTSSAKLVSAGIYVGEAKGKDFVPHHSLAMSLALNRETFVTFEADTDTAIAYLRREALNLPSLPKGYVLLTYRGLPLGFAKNIGNRANNLYPNEWRIRSAKTDF